MRLVSSRAKSSPIIVTKRAESLRVSGIVKICVLVGVMLKVIIRPAKILP